MVALANTSMIVNSSCEDLEVQGGHSGCGT